MTNSLRPRCLSCGAQRGVSIVVASELAVLKFVGRECANGQTLNSSTWRLSWRANRSNLQSRGSRGAGLGLWRTVERWRSNAHQEEGMVGDCTWTLFKESNVGESSVVSIAHALNDSATSGFYYDELQEAVVAIKNRAKEAETLDAFISGRTEEKTVQPGEGADVKKSEAESESGNSNWDDGRDLWMSAKGKLPIESNGPPMVMLQPYLVSKNSQEQSTPKLRRLPLPMPHMSRSLGFPRVSLSHKLGIVSPRKSMLKSHVSYFTVKDLATDIRDLPVSAHVSEVLNKWVWQLKKGYLARTVRELGQMELKERALQVLFWLKNIPHLWPDHTTLCTVIQVMVEGGEVDTAFELQRTMGSDSKRVTQSLAIALAKAGMLIELVEVFNYIKQFGWKIDGRVHSKLIQFAYRTGGRDIVESLLRDWITKTYP